MLLRADGKVQSLERPHAPSVKLREEAQEDFIARETFDVGVEGPAIRLAQPRALRPAMIAPLAPIETGMKRRLHGFGDAVEVRIGKIEDGVTVAIEAARDVENDRLRL